MIFLNLHAFSQADNLPNPPCLRPASNTPFEPVGALFISGCWDGGSFDWTGRLIKISTRVSDKKCGPLSAFAFFATVCPNLLAVPKSPIKKVNARFQWY